MRSDACLAPPMEAVAPAVGFSVRGREIRLCRRRAKQWKTASPRCVPSMCTPASKVNRHSLTRLTPEGTLVPCKPTRPSPSRSSITRMPIGGGLWGRARISNPQDHAHRSPADHDGAFCFCAFHALSQQPGTQPRIHRRFRIDDTGRSDASRIEPLRNPP